jgi:hypothetical protein
MDVECPTCGLAAEWFAAARKGYLRWEYTSAAEAYVIEKAIEKVEEKAAAMEELDPVVYEEMIQEAIEKAIAKLVMDVAKSQAVRPK